MQRDWCRRALRAAVCGVSRLGVAAVCALALAGCSIEGQPALSLAQPRGATVAFESIDGMPAVQFATLVRSLNDEAQSRHLAVVSRESPSAYRVRGNFAAKVVKGRATIAWAWEVFDGNEQRALRIAGEETVDGRHRDAWSVADDAMLKRIAHASMERLATFLTSPEAAPGAPVAAAEPQLIRAATPEAAGIFRIFRPQADPIQTGGAAAPAGPGDKADRVPQARGQTPPSAISAGEAPTFTIAGR